MKLKPNMLGALGALGILGIFLHKGFGLLALLALLGLWPDRKPESGDKELS